ncbi:MAG: helix-turn-helix transcriptional regulator, partial [Anaerotardibacter sp.]
AEGFYYLTAYTKKYDDFSHYRIDRIEKVVVTDEPADRNKKIANYSFNEQEYQQFGSFGGEAVSVVLAVKADKVEIVLDRFGSDVTLSKEENGIVKAYVTVSKSQQFYGWIAGLDKAVTIASPASLVQDCKEYLQKLIND